MNGFFKDKYLRQVFLACAALTLTAYPAVAQAPAAGTTPLEPALTRYFVGQPPPSSRKRVRVLIFWTPDNPSWTSYVPHLSLLSDDFTTKADFTGIAVTDNAAAARTIVQQQTKSLHFPQALATDAVIKAYLGEKPPALPVVIVQDKDGKVTWVGQPYDGLEDAIRATIAGTIEPEKEAQRQQQLQALSKASAQLEMPITLEPTALADQLRTIDNFLAKADPLWKGGTVLYPSIYRMHTARYRLLLEHDSPDALPYLQHLADTYYSENAFMLNDMAWYAAHSKKPSKELRRWAYVTAQRACKIHSYQWARHIDTLAFAAWRNGDRGSAIMWQQRADETAKRDARIPDSVRPSISQSVARYRDEKNTPGELLSESL